MNDTKLDGFPAFYKGEVIVNELARFTKRIKPVSYADWLQELFGKPHQQLIVDLPTNLNRLTKRIPEIYDYHADHLINYQTAAPYYRLGRSKAQIRQLDTAMKEQGAANVHLYAGLASAGVLRPRFLRGCNSCIETDRSQEGEAYLHRDHHLAGIDVCAEHGIFLGNTYCSSSKMTKFVTLEDLLRDQDLDMANQGEPDPCLTNLARDAQYLLDHPNIQIDPGKIHQLYRAACLEQGFIGKTGQLHIQDVAERVRDYYPADILRQLNLSLNPDINKSWVYELFAAPHVSRPSIKHLLVIQGLGYSVKSLLDLEIPENVESNPFGDGPWRCLNKAASHYMQPVISECNLAIFHERMRGEFSCECGFCYSLTELKGEQPNELNHRVFGNCTIRVLRYGDEWDSALRRMWNDDDFRLKDMAEALGVSGDTVKAQTPRLGLLFPPSGSPNLKPPPLNKQRVQREIKAEYRDKWLKEGKERPDASFTQLRDSLPDEAAWLHLYDRKWFDSHKPKRISPGRPRKDWSAFDLLLAAKVDVAGLRRSSDPASPRITPALSSRDIGYDSNYLSSRLSKLRQTKKVLEKYVESPEQYALRRMDAVRNWAIAEKIPLTVYQIRKRAGISERLAGRDAIKIQLNQIANELEKYSISI